MKKHHYLMAWPALAIIILDQVSKLTVLHFLRLHESVSVTCFFNLVHVRNRGMAFGLMNRTGIDFGFYVLTAASVGAVIILLVWFLRLKQDRNRIAFGLGLIFGGAVGNLIDRLRLREVVDFLDFYLGPYHWPSFNIADSAITVGTLWLCIVLISKRSST